MRKLHPNTSPRIAALRSLLRTLSVALLVFATFRCSAQSQPNIGQYEIHSITFEGNDSFSTNELLRLLQTKETPGFFNKFLYKTISERLGRKDEYFDPIMMGEDVSRVRQFYRDHGFHEAQVDTALTFFRQDTTIEILIRVQEGYQSKIDTLRYDGFANVREIVTEEMNADPKIVKGDPFNKSTIEEEVKRVLQILKNDGYARATFVRDLSSITYYTSSRNYSVTLCFDLGKVYRFGDITFHQEQDPIREDIQNEVLLGQLDYEKGEVYSQENLRFSEKNLNRIGMFDRAWIETTLPASGHPESTIVATTVRVRARDKHELAPEILFSNDDNNNFTFGSGLGYTQRNFFGGGRTFSTHLRFRTQNFRDFPDVFNANNNAIANADLTFELVQPYIFSNKIKGTWSFSAIADKQNFYINRILQNKFGITDQFAEFTTGFLDWTLQLVSLEKKSHIAADSANADDLRGLKDLAIQDSLQQFNSILSFTIQRDMTNDIFSPSRGFSHALTVEESGLLPLAFKTDPRRYTQFYRTSFLLRWYLETTEGNRFSIFAFKLRGGYESKYGGSFADTARTIPQTHRFYAGGGGSVRGWRSRDLSVGGNPQFGGNVLAEASMELRTNLFHSLRDDFLDKLWTVLFIDVGNVWAEARNMQIRSVAAAAGFGIRYDTFFGPFRIDYGLQVYDPRASVNGNSWVTQRKFWGETLRLGVIHFGIGHSF